MEVYESVVKQIALTMGIAWASGLNLYAAIGMLGLLGATGSVELPAGLQVLQHPAVIVIACGMYVVEFFADKIPGIDTLWDGLHTFVRIPAGAVLAAVAVGHVDPSVQLAAALLGGAVATGTHVAKAGTRAVVNVSPEPFSNWFLSIGEDVAVFGGLWVALYHPWLFLLLFVLFCAALAWLLPRLWRGFQRVWSVFARRLRSGPVSPPAGPP